MVQHSLCQHLLRVNSPTLKANFAALNILRRSSLETVSRFKIHNARELGLGLDGVNVKNKNGFTRFAVPASQWRPVLRSDRCCYCKIDVLILRGTCCNAE